jgi:hypothetical protein
MFTTSGLTCIYKSTIDPTSRACVLLQELCECRVTERRVTTNRHVKNSYLGMGLYERPYQAGGVPQDSLGVGWTTDFLTGSQLQEVGNFMCNCIILRLICTGTCIASSAKRMNSPGTDC